MNSDKFKQGMQKLVEDVFAEQGVTIQTTEH